MKRVSQGTALERLVHNIGGGMNQIVTGGAGSVAGGAAGSALGPVGTAAGVVAGGALGNAVSRMAGAASERIARRNAEIARALVASGGVPNLPVASDTSRKIAESLLRRQATAQTAQ